MRRSTDKNLSSFDDISNEKFRHQTILQEIKDFIKNDNYNVLLLKGQSNGMDERYGNTLKMCALLFLKLKNKFTY